MGRHRGGARLKGIHQRRHVIGKIGWICESNRGGRARSGNTAASGGKDQNVANTLHARARCRPPARSAGHGGRPGIARSANRRSTQPNKHLRPWRTPQPAIKNNPQWLPPLEPNRPDVKLRIIGEHRSNTRHHGGTSCTPALHVVAGTLAGYPLTRTVRQRGAAVQTHRKFDAHPGQTVLHPLHETDVDFSGLRLHEPGFDGDPGAQQGVGALATYTRIGILYGENHARDTRFDQRIHAGGCATEMAARLECYICSRTRNWLLRRAQRRHFRVRLPSTLMPAFRDDPLAFRYDTANAGIWMSCLETPLGERQCTRHRQSIEFRKHYITASQRP